MPNHITTVCIVTGLTEKVAAFRAAHIKPTDPAAHNLEFFDFESIIPMPASIQNTIRGFREEDRKPGEPADHVGDLDVEWYAEACIRSPNEYLAARSPALPADVRKWGELKAWLEAKKPAAVFWGKRALLAAAETGHSGWYPWSIANWGTKWNSYNYKLRFHDPGRLVFAFDTAWAPPVPVFAKLAAMWPELTMETKSIDEGGGAWAGKSNGTAYAIDKTEETRALHVEVYGSAERLEGDEASC